MGRRVPVQVGWNGIIELHTYRTCLTDVKLAALSILLHRYPGRL